MGQRLPHQCISLSLPLSPSTPLPLSFLSLCLCRCLSFSEAGDRVLSIRFMGNTKICGSLFGMYFEQVSLVLLEQLPLSTNTYIFSRAPSDMCNRIRWFVRRSICQVKLCQLHVSVSSGRKEFRRVLRRLTFLRAITIFQWLLFYNEAHEYSDEGSHGGIRIEFEFDDCLNNYNCSTLHGPACLLWTL